ncbi:hypothetical protein Tco_0845561 [Tanacetum coccineum]
MANLEFCDTHNMVAYLKKIEGNEGFHQIVDFLNSSHIRILDNREMEITATIDGKVKIVSKASIRRHLKLDDSDGINNLLTTEIFEQLALMGQESMVPQPRSPTQTNVADEAASISVDVRHGGAATTFTILDVKKLEKTIKTRQAKRKARIFLSDDEEDLEDPSKQGRKIVEIDQDPDISLVQHDAEVQGRHEHDMESDFEFTTAEEVYTAEKEVSTAKPVSTAGALVSTAGASSTKDKGKAIMEEAETILTKTKLQLEQERLGYEEALRL